MAKSGTCHGKVMRVIAKAMAKIEEEEKTSSCYPSQGQINGIYNPIMGMSSQACADPGVRTPSAPV